MVPENAPLAPNDLVQVSLVIFSQNFKIVEFKNFDFYMLFRLISILKKLVKSKLRVCPKFRYVYFLLLPVFLYR